MLGGGKGYQRTEGGVEKAHARAGETVAISRTAGTPPWVFPGVRRHNGDQAKEKAVILDESKAARRGDHSIDGSRLASLHGGPPVVALGARRYRGAEICACRTFRY